MSENEKAFLISYSGAHNDELQKIKEKYTPSRKNQKLNKVRKLDARVDFISTMISIAVGILGSVMLILGVLVIIKQRDMLLAGSLSVILGLAVVSCVPLLHFRIVECLKKHTAPKILKLIEDIEKNQI